jgi:hypothetical protein
MERETHRLLETRAKMRTPNECATHIATHYNVEENTRFIINWLLGNPKIDIAMMFYWIEVLDLLNERR